MANGLLFLLIIIFSCFISKGAFSFSFFLEIPYSLDSDVAPKKTGKPKTNTQPTNNSGAQPKYDFLFLLFRFGFVGFDFDFDFVSVLVTAVFFFFWFRLRFVFG
jgi:hypothetical protein